jgi:type III secretory pathway component EscS
LKTLGDRDENNLKQPTEKLGLFLGSLSLFLFWAPPIGIAFGVAGLVVSISQLGKQLRHRKTAITLSALGILLFVGFWGSIWLLSQ